MLNWINENSFVVDGVKFTLDWAPGGSQRVSTPNDFTMMKGAGFLTQYCALAGPFDRILELGVYQGGGLVFFDRLFRPKKISAIELSTTPVPALDAYAERTEGRMRVHYGTSQDDAERLSKIVQEDFGGVIDLVVDDASHFYQPTRASFVELFPRLRAGGIYIIEDWTWSFQADFQRPDAPWRERDALANLVIDLMEDMAVNNMIADVRITGEMITVTRSNVSPASPMLSVTARRQRPYTPL